MSQASIISFKYQISSFFQCWIIVSWFQYLSKCLVHVLFQVITKHPFQVQIHLSFWILFKFSVPFTHPDPLPWWDFFWFSYNSNSDISYWFRYWIKFPIQVLLKMLAFFFTNYHDQSILIKLFDIAPCHPVVGSNKMCIQLLINIFDPPYLLDIVLSSPFSSRLTSFENLFFLRLTIIQDRVLAQFFSFSIGLSIGSSIGLSIGSNIYKDFGSNNDSNF